MQDQSSNCCSHFTAETQVHDLVGSLYCSHQPGRSQLWWWSCPTPKPESLKEKEGCSFSLSSFFLAAPLSLQMAIPIPRVVANTSEFQVTSIIVFLQNVGCWFRFRPMNLFSLHLYIYAGTGSMPKSGDYFLMEHREDVPDYCK